MLNGLTHRECHSLGNQLRPSRERLERSIPTKQGFKRCLLGQIGLYATHFEFAEPIVIVFPKCGESDWVIRVTVL